MDSSNSAAAVRPRHGVLRALTFAALLSAASMAALAAPSISGKPVTSVTAAHYFSFQPSASNPGGGAVSFVVSNKPSWASFDAGTGRLYGTPLPQTNVGTFSNIVISASAGGQRASLAPFAITVLPLPNIPPTIAGSPAPSVVTGSAYAFQPKATDPNGLQVGFGIYNKPSWASFNSTTGLLSGTPVGAERRNVFEHRDYGLRRLFEGRVAGLQYPRAEIRLKSARHPVVGLGYDHDYGLRHALLDAAHAE